MKYDVQLCEVLRRAQTAENTFDYTVLAPKLAKVAQPGQFAHIYVPGKTLRRPISICDIDKKNGTLRFVFQIRGAGTEQLSKFEVGDKMDVLRPSATALRSTRTRTICSSAAVSVCLRFSAQQGNAAKRTVAVGFRNKDFVILEDDFRAAGCDLRIATDDGSYGHHGLVIDLIQDVHPDKIFACGPKVMLRAVTEFAKAHNIPCEISLEERMACGIGACLGCAVELYDENGETYMGHVCKDGRCSRRKGWYSDG